MALCPVVNWLATPMGVTPLRCYPPPSPPSLLHCNEAKRRCYQGYVGIRGKEGGGAGEVADVRRIMIAMELMGEILKRCGHAGTANICMYGF